MICLLNNRIYNYVHLNINMNVVKLFRIEHAGYVYQSISTFRTPFMEWILYFFLLVLTLSPNI